MSNSSKSFFLKVLFVIMVFIFIFVEIISFLILNIYPNLSYDENKITQSFNEYKIKRDTILGWNKVVNKFGNSRNLPNREFVKDTSTQIDFYGDSYTYGAEVNDDKHIWTNLISKELKVIVNNKGVGGFGSDQSYLKFQINKNPSKIVVLNHLSENIIRNVNQFRHLIYPSNYYDLKPIFIIENKKLTLKSIPILNSNLEEFKKTPNNYLKYEYFKLGSKSGIYYKKFPYSLTLFRSLLTNWKIKSIYKYYSGYQPFYDLNHESNGINVTKGIFECFILDSKEKDLIPIITILPTYRDFEFYNKYKFFPYKTLVDLLDQNSFFIDFGHEIIKSKKNFNLGDALNLYKSKPGHMNENGHKIISKIFTDFIKTNKLF